ncbi:MAG: hypothetical protein AB8I08_39150 [Sandaracinaceae bacterium]
MLPRHALTLLLLALTACGGGRPPPEPPPSLDDEDGQSFEFAGIELPPLPLDVEEDDLADGWSPVERALTEPAPRPPVGEDWEVDAWADDVLADWISRRATLLAEAQRALAMLREGDPEISVVASTLLGLTYSRFALDLRGIATPAAFRDDEAREDAFRSALDRMARPLFRRAVDAYGSCSATAMDGPAYALARWREHCDRELRMLAPMVGSDDDPDAEEEAEE